MKNALLVLCPDNPHWAPPDNPGLKQFLQSIQLIGEPYQGETQFYTGEKFLELVAFLGCSPDIKLEPGDKNQSFCRIHVQTGAEEVEFHCGEHTHAPRCTQCRSPVNNWQNEITTWRENGAGFLWTCESCKHQAAPWQYNWRKSAGFGKCFIEINDIFPKEAIPQQHLLDTLNSHYGVGWNYFFQY